VTGHVNRLVLPGGAEAGHQGVERSRRDSHRSSDQDHLHLAVGDQLVEGRAAEAKERRGLPDRDEQRRERYPVSSGGLIV